MISRALNVVLRWFAWVSAALIIVIMFLTVSDIVARYVFNNPIPSVLEVSEILLVALVFLAFGWTQARRKHLRVEVLTTKLRQKLQIFLEVFMFVLCLCIFGLLTWQSGFAFAEAWREGEYVLGLINVPLWPAKLVMLIGLAGLSARFAVDIGNNVQQLHNLKGKA